MSNSAGADDDDEEEGGGGGGSSSSSSEAEEFYESLDRILSSSCSSTSASSDDDSSTTAPGNSSHHRSRHHHRRRSSPPSLDVWVAEPAPVQERRRRLLEQLGLSNDHSLTRHTGVSTAAGEVDVARSVPCDSYLRSTPAAAANAGCMGRSRSDNSVDPPPGDRSKPPPVMQFRSASSDSIEVVEEFRERREDDPDDETRCLIKDLDNGAEFVVKESRVRELRTGRQLTMEEFELCVGRSPIVQELMRRQRNVEELSSGSSTINGVNTHTHTHAINGETNAARTKKRSSWFKSIKSMGSGHRDRRSSDERDTSSEKGGRRSSSATDDSQDGSSHAVPEKAKVRYYGKSHREITGLYMNQEIQAHSGSIWSVKFSLDGRYLASAGEDCVIQVWEVSELDKRGEVFGERESNGSGSGGCNPFVAAVTNGSPEPGLGLGLGLGLNDVNYNHWEKKRRARGVGGRKSASLDHIMVPEHVFALSEKPVCSFRGHSDDVLDLSWSKSQYLLSSSMDKTVRLWHMESNTCLKMFSHSDYVTCIQFNPVDDRYFISGSLDEKVRIWSIPDRQIVDWTDLHEMVTAACYSPDGQSALVGSHKGSCHMYDTSDNKLLQKTQIDLQNKRKKSTQKKVTGFQFAPGSSSKVLITSADSRIRVIDGVDLVHKLKGFRNTSSQITACISANGKYVVSASEDSHVYVWRYDDDSEPGRTKGSIVTCTQSYEYFHCQDVTVAVVWPSPTTLCPNLTAENNNGFKTNGENNRTRATWPEEIVNSRKNSPRNNNNNNNSNADDDAFININSPVDIFNCGIPAQTRSAWGMVIVTAGRGGQIRTFQNFGFPVRV